MKPDTWLRLVEAGIFYRAQYTDKDGNTHWGKVSSKEAKAELLKAIKTSEPPSALYARMGWAQKAWSEPVGGTVLWEAEQTVTFTPPPAVKKPFIPKVIPAKCAHEHTLLGPNCPSPPHHIEKPEDHERNVASRQVIRRWVASNYREWPVCHVTRQPVDLFFWSTQAEGGIGTCYKAAFACRTCHG